MGEIVKNTVTDAIMDRRSIRSYLNMQISERELHTILEAGIWAPTANNRQEIDFYVVQDRNIIDAFSRKFSEFMKSEPYRDFSYGAPTLIFLYGKTGSRFMEVDSGIAVENMTLAAQSLGLGSVIIGCIKEFLDCEAGAEYKKSFGVPEGWTFCIAIALGYTANPTAVKPRREGKVHFC